MARFETITGRYVYLMVDDVEYRVYFEESGTGIPLLLQHSAGSDGRQWRHLLEDPDVSKHFRMVAYDLPYHGRSLPPLSVKWWQEEYVLTKAFLEEFVLSLSDELELKKPAFMGSSMGGHLAADLALDFPDRFRALIGVEAALETKGGAERLRWLNHPRLNEHANASLMYTSMAPTSPENLKRETVWCYDQAAPGVFKGDYHYYTVEHDLTKSASGIDTSTVPIFLLGGEYDFSADPASVRALADEIEGSYYQEMAGVGHFPMAENPKVFKEYLLPVLEKIRAL